MFAGNRTKEIRALVPPNLWFRCPGAENPGDILSRGMNVTKFSESIIPGLVDANG